MPVVRQPSRCPLAPLDAWILVFGEAALAADLITAWRILSYLGSRGGKPGICSLIPAQQGSGTSGARMGTAVHRPCRHDEFLRRHMTGTGGTMNSWPHMHGSP